MHTWFRRRRWLWIAPLVLLGAGGTALALSRDWVQAQAESLIYHDLGLVPARPVGIVFGARVFPNGALSTVLRARVDAGIRLYHAGKVQKLLMSGDNSTRDYDEVTAMKNYAVSHGVPPADVVRDYAGFRTLDSCYRARNVFQIDRAILVTQEFHLPRAIYLARAQGMDVVGFAAPPGVDARTLQSLEAREMLAVPSAILDTALGRKAKFEGPVEPLFGDSRPDR